MTEQDFRQALRGVMATSSPPPPMSSTAMLRRARRAQTRWRFAWTGCGSAVLTATVVVTASLVSGTPAGTGLAAPPPSGYPAPPSGTAEPSATGSDGTPQQDRTATSGVRYQQGAMLLQALKAAVPAGYTVTHPTHLAEFAYNVNGVDVWDYSASVVVAKSSDGSGTISALVYTVGNTFTGVPCDLAERFGRASVCEELTVGPAKVAVGSTTMDDRFEEWSAYRQPDGVVIFVAQTRKPTDSSPPLPALPLTKEQLAGLAADERFHLR
jgi:hypothetical protein